MDPMPAASRLLVREREPIPIVVQHLRFDVRALPPNSAFATGCIYVATSCPTCTAIKTIQKRDPSAPLS